MRVLIGYDGYGIRLTAGEEVKKGRGKRLMSLLCWV